MTLVLIGPPASGKSRVGRRVARRLAREFRDTDKLVAAEHGPIAELFERDGEARFRALERAAVADAVRAGGVVSLGGGAVLDAATQADLADCIVVLLTIDADAVGERLASGKRPLSRDVESWAALVAQRMPLYRRLADHTIDTSRRPVDDIVAEVAAWVEAREKEAGSDER